jgi:hypothetical protein
MRGKLIAVFSTVVLIVGVLLYALTRAIASKDAVDAEEAPRALNAALAELQVQGLAMERWLNARAVDPRMRDPFKAGTQGARSEAATLEANRIADAASAAPALGVQPTVVMLVNSKGIVLGRNGSALMRGDDIGKVYPRLIESIERGSTGSDVWVNPERNEQLLASYAPVRDEDGTWLGALVVGSSINDERLKTASDRTSGRYLLAAVPNGEGLTVVAKSTGTPSELTTAIAEGAAKERALSALKTGQMVDLAGLPEGFSAKARPLEGYGDGRSALLISGAAPADNQFIRDLLWPALGVTLLGLVLVAIASVIIDNYISRPIAELEEGMLAIMNGKTDLRFEIEHAELGGLVFRINSLLNQLLGVQEDDTDEQGRPSRSPTAGSFEDALAVDERMATLSGEDVADAKTLREEPDSAYYNRIFREYIEAKRSLGDPVDHITEEAFSSRIMASEREMAAKHGKPVRYKVEVKGKEVMLLAVPLA